MEQQIVTFESTWSMLKPGGVYICEVRCANRLDLNILQPVCAV